MKKSLVFLAGLSLILILSFSIISAFSFSDFWKKFTGQVVVDDACEQAGGVYCGYMLTNGVFIGDGICEDYGCFKCKDGYYWTGSKCVETCESSGGFCGYECVYVDHSYNLGIGSCAYGDCCECNPGYYWTGSECVKTCESSGGFCGYECVYVDHSYNLGIGSCAYGDCCECNPGYYWTGSECIETCVHAGGRGGYDHKGCYERCEGDYNTSKSQGDDYCGLWSTSYLPSCCAYYEGYGLENEKDVVEVETTKCSDNTTYGSCSIDKPKYCGNKNLLKNADFEVDDKPLTFGGFKGTVLDDGQILSNLIKVEPNKKYKISGQIKTALDQGTAYVAVYQYETETGDAINVNGQSHFNAFSQQGIQNWTYYSNTFETDSNTSFLRIRLDNWGSSGALGNAEYKEVELTDGIPDEWTFFNVDSNLVTDASKGNLAVKGPTNAYIVAGIDDLEQSIGVANLSGKKLFVSIDAKSENNSTLGVYIYALKNKQYDYANSARAIWDQTLTSDYKKYSAVYDIPEVEEGAGINYSYRLIIYSSNKQGNLYFDSVSLEEYSEEIGLIDYCEFCGCDEGEKCIGGVCVNATEAEKYVLKSIPTNAIISINTFEYLKRENKPLGKAIPTKTEITKTEFQSGKLPPEKHPVVLYTDIEIIKDRITREPYSGWWNQIKNSGDWVLTKEISGLRRFDRAKYAKTTAFIYAVTGEEKYGDKSRDLLLSMNGGASYEGFQDVDGLAWFAEAYDMLNGTGYSFSKESEIRGKLKKQMQELADTSITEVFSEDIVRYNNLHIRRYSAVGIAAIVLNNEEFFDRAMNGGTAFEEAGEAGDFILAASQFVWQTLTGEFNAELASIGFKYEGVEEVIDYQIIDKNEGGWAEGPGYMTYTFRIAIPFLKTMENAGISNSLLSISKFKNLFDWGVKIRMPNGARPPYDDSSISYFFSAYLNDPVYNWDWINADNKYYSPSLKIDSISYYDDTVGIKEPEWGPSLALPETGNIVLRSGWGKDDIYLMFLGENGVAVKHGLAHEQPDVMNFILYAYGKYLAIDSGYIDYPNRHKTGQPEHHNIVLVNNAHTCEEGFIQEQDFFSTDFLDYGEIRDRYSKHERGILFIDKEYFLVFDVLDFGSDKNYEWRIHGNGLRSEGSAREYALGSGGEWDQGDVSLLAYVLPKQDDAVKFGESIHANSWRQESEHTYMGVLRTGEKVGFLSLLYPAKNKDYPIISSGSYEGADVLMLEKDDWKGFAFVNKDKNLVKINEELNIKTDASKCFVKTKDNGLSYIFADDVKQFYLDEKLLFESENPTTIAILVDEDIEIYYKYYNGIGGVEFYTEAKKVLYDGVEMDDSHNQGLVKLGDEENLDARFIKETTWTCGDKTKYNFCSSTKPLYCDDGNLIYDCQTCGCPSDLICKEGGNCEIKGEGPEILSATPKLFPCPQYGYGIQIDWADKKIPNADHYYIQYREEGGEWKDLFKNLAISQSWINHLPTETPETSCKNQKQEICNRCLSIGQTYEYRVKVQDVNDKDLTDWSDVYSETMERPKFENLYCEKVVIVDYFWLWGCGGCGDGWKRTSCADGKRTCKRWYWTGCSETSSCWEDTILEREECYSE